MNSLKITGLANGTASGDAVNFGQLSALPSGSGAANRMALWTGANTLSHNVGIQWVVGGNESYLQFGSGATPANVFVGTNVGAGYKFSVYDPVGSVHRMIISNAGNAGFGTVLPEAKVHAVGNYLGEQDYTYNGSLALGNGLTPVYGIGWTGNSVLNAGIGAYNDGNVIQTVFINNSKAITAFSAGTNRNEMRLISPGQTANWALLFVSNNGSSAGSDWIHAPHTRVVAAQNVGLRIGSYGANEGVEIYGGTAVQIAKFTTAGVRLNMFTTPGTLVSILNSSGDLTSVSPYDFSGTLTANRTMTLGSNAFTFDASGAGSSPNTMLILKGKETSFNTRFIDYQNESGATSFLMSSNSSLVTLSAQNVHDLRLEGVSTVTIGNNLDRNFVVRSSGAFSPFSGLSGDPSSPSAASMWWRSNIDNGRLRVQRSIGAASFATVEDDLIGDSMGIISTTNSFTGGAKLNWRIDVGSSAISQAVGSNLLEGLTYLIRVRQNTSTNTMAFNAESGFVFYVDEKSTLTLATLVTGGGSGIEAANRIYQMRRLGTVIYIK